MIIGFQSQAITAVYGDKMEFEDLREIEIERKWGMMMQKLFEENVSSHFIPGEVSQIQAWGKKGELRPKEG